MNCLDSIILHKKSRNSIISNRRISNRNSDKNLLNKKKYLKDKVSRKYVRRNKMIPYILIERKIKKKRKNNALKLREVLEI